MMSKESKNRDRLMNLISGITTGKITPEKLNNPVIFIEVSHYSDDPDHYYDPAGTKYTGAELQEMVKQKAESIKNIPTGIVWHEVKSYVTKSTI